MALPVAIACGSDDGKPATGSSGGVTSSGGNVSSGGGSQQTGGSGGSTSSGGSPASGGTTSSGGGIASGGTATASGGASASGDASASGGTDGGSDAGDASSGTGGATPSEGGPDGSAVPYESKATSQGVVDGVTFVPTGVVGATTRNGEVSGAGIAIADVSLPCERIEETHKTNVDYANVRALFLTVGDRKSPQIGLGTYAIGDSTSDKQGRAGFNHNGDDCTTAERHDAMSGIIEITTIDASGIAGSYTLTFENTEVISGTFQGPWCTALLQQATGTGDEVCRPRPVD